MTTVTATVTWHSSAQKVTSIMGLSRPDHGLAALGNGVDVSIFFTFWGLDMIREDRVDHLEVPPGGVTRALK